MTQLINQQTADIAAIGAARARELRTLLHAVEHGVDQATLIEFVRAFQHQLSGDFTAIQAMIVLGCGDPRQGTQQERTLS